MSRRTIRRALGSAVVALLVLDVVAAFQLGVRAQRAPSFRRGGSFAAARADLPADRPLPYAPAAPSTTASTAPLPAPSIAGAPSTSAAAAPTTTVPGAASPVAAAAATAVVPAPGTYTYAVDGSESATGFGTRTLPETMTMTVNADPDGDAATRVLDLRFSAQHEEREIATFGPDGVAFVFEAGSVTFGPYTRTSEADYDPPMLQVPGSLAPGVVVQGTTDASSRVEDWTVTVEGTERVGAYDTWVVRIDRQSQPGSSEEVQRTRRYWFAPALGIWVKWTEELHASQTMAGATFGYACEYTAILESVAP
jgi:hypothetical protein